MANPKCYSVQWAYATASPTKTSATLTSTSAVRPEAYDWYLGSAAVPADNALLWQWQRFTAAGTGTAYTPPPLDPADPASTSIAGVNLTVEPTYTSGLILFAAALNQRAMGRAILDPRGPLKCPATSNNGIGLSAANASFTGNNNGTFFFNE